MTHDAWIMIWLQGGIPRAAGGWRFWVTVDPCETQQEFSTNQSNLWVKDQKGRNASSSRWVKNWVRILLESQQEFSTNQSNLWVKNQKRRNTSSSRTGSGFYLEPPPPHPPSTRYSSTAPWLNIQPTRHAPLLTRHHPLLLPSHPPPLPPFTPRSCPTPRGGWLSCSTAAARQPTQPPANHSSSSNDPNHHFARLPQTTHVLLPLPQRATAAPHPAAGG